MFTKFSALILCLLLSRALLAGDLPMQFGQYSAERPFVVLIPGSGASAGRLEVQGLTKLLKLSGQDDYFSGYKKSLIGLNQAFTFCPQNPDGDTRLLTLRAIECSEMIASLVRRTPKARNILLIGHSMGGNIARLVAANPFISSRIQAVLTIATPHRGTPLADFVFDQYDPNRGWESAVYKTVMELIGFTPFKKKYFIELTAEHNSPIPGIYLAQNVLDAPNVKYFSISNSNLAPSLPVLLMTKNIINDEIERRGIDTGTFGNANDGVIPEYSMVHGVHLARVKADHWEVLCIGILERTEGCRQLRKVLLPFLTSFNKGLL